MTRTSHLTPRFTDIIPEGLDPGVLYISRRYATASHLCCCGCGLEVVTPLNPAKWRLTEDDGVVSLLPSIGNWSFPCQSHYWIVGNRVRWAEAMPPHMIAAVKSRDRCDAERLARPALSIFRRVHQAIGAAWARLLGHIKNSWRR